MEVDAHSQPSPSAPSAPAAPAAPAPPGAPIVLDEDADDAVADELSPDTAVRLRGLKGAAHLNGRRAIVRSWLAERGRYEVTLHPDGETKAVLPANVQPLPILQEVELLRDRLTSDNGPQSVAQVVVRSALNRLTQLRLTSEILVDTKVGKTVNNTSQAFAGKEDEISDLAKRLVLRWKDMYRRDVEADKVIAEKAAREKAAAEQAAAKRAFVERATAAAAKAAQAAQAAQASMPQSPPASAPAPLPAASVARAVGGALGNAAVGVEEFKERPETKRPRLAGPEAARSRQVPAAAGIGAGAPAAPMAPAAARSQRAAAEAAVAATTARSLAEIAAAATALAAAPNAAAASSAPQPAAAALVEQAMPAVEEIPDADSPGPEDEGEEPPLTQPELESMMPAVAQFVHGRPKLLHFLRKHPSVMKNLNEDNLKFLIRNVTESQRSGQQQGRKPRQAGSASSKTVTISNLPQEAVESDLVSLINTAGLGSAEVSLPRESRFHRTCGIAYITLSSRRAAAEAVNALTGVSVLGSRIQVNDVGATQTAQRGGRRISWADNDELWNVAVYNKHESVDRFRERIETHSMPAPASGDAETATPEALEKFRQASAAERAEEARRLRQALGQHTN